MEPNKCPPPTPGEVLEWSNEEDISFTKFMKSVETLFKLVIQQHFRMSYQTIKE